MGLLNRLLSRVPLLYRAFFPGARWYIPSLEGKSVYLTFDDGPIPEITPWTLDLLDKYQIKATFFCVGDNVRKYPHIFEDVFEAHNLIQSRYFRPPYGHMRLGQMREVSHSFEIIMWDVLTRDYNHKRSPKQVLKNVMDYTRNGSIIVFHDSIKSERNLKEALPQAIEWLLQEGYQFKRIGDAP